MSRPDRFPSELFRAFVWALVAACVSMPAASFGAQEDSAAARTAIHDFFDGLVGGRWVAAGEWPNGQPFQQEQIYEWALGDRIVEVTTFGPLDEGGAMGERSKGVRAWDEARDEARFWEFDRFGNIVDGRCFLDGDTLVYEYEYAVEGELQTLRDSWRPVGEDEFEMSVAQRGADGEFQVLLSTTYTRAAQ